MLERTTWEKEAEAARKKGLPIPKKPKSSMIKQPRTKFAYDDIPDRPALEPPAPTSEYAQKKIPASYRGSNVTDSRVVAVREGKLPDVSIAGKQAGWSDLRIDWNVEGSTVPTGFPYFVRGRDSVRAYITSLFNKEVTMYDGAMGTMIQKQSKWLDEAAFRGEL
jgi:hypothetical protein